MTSSTSASRDSFRCARSGSSTTPRANPDSAISDWPDSGKPDAARERELWDWLNRHRDERPEDQLQAFLADPQLAATWRDFAQVGTFPAFTHIAAAPHVVSFFARHASRVGPGRVLDPYALSPLTAAAMAAAVPEAEVVAYSPSADVIRYGPQLAPTVDWRHLVSPTDVQGAGEFDLIAGSPPFGGRRFLDAEIPQELIDGPKAAWPADDSGKILAISALQLSNGGQLALQLAQGINSGHQSKLLLDWLVEQGVFRWAALSVLKGVQASNIVSEVSIFGPWREQDLFLARVTPKASLEEIVENLHARTAGAVPELGILAPAEGYLGWGQAMARFEVDAVLERSPVTVRIADLALSVERFERADSAQVTEFQNSLIFPRAGEGPVRTRLEANSRIRRAIVIALDPDRADAEFLARWFNGPGRSFLRSVATGATISWIGAKSLAEIRIPLPPIEVQNRNSDLFRQISGLRAELDLLGERVSEAVSATELEGARWELGRLRAGSDLVAWVERLPFPVASVLHLYLAESEGRARLEYLLRFFESFAAFCATLLLSAVRVESALWLRAREKIARSGQHGQTPFDRIHFDSWIAIGRIAAKALRPQLDGASAGSSDGLLGLADGVLGMALVGRKEVWDLLEGAREVRNRGAHSRGGSIDERLDDLEGLLGELHSEFGVAFDRVQLVQPGECRIERSLNRFPGAKDLRGPNPVLTGGEVVSLMTLRHDGLFLVDRERTVEISVELLPLIRLLPSGNAAGSKCVFFNRSLGGGRFEFNTFDSGAVEVVADQELRDLVAELGHREV